jgi:recombination protein U
MPYLWGQGVCGGERGVSYRQRANLGDPLENLLTTSCEMYKAQGRAEIFKVPTPYKIIGQQGGKLLCVPDHKSTVDFIGQIRGRPVAIEAKSTSERTRYPLDPYNREKHQREMLKKWAADGCISGYIIGFMVLGEYYWLPYSQYSTWYEQSRKGGRKSIPIGWFREQAIGCRTGRVPIDFLPAMGVE